MHALQKHLPFEVDHFALLPCPKRADEGLENVLTPIVGEEYTEFHLCVVGKTERVGLVLKTAPRVASRIAVKRNGPGVSNAY